MIKIKWVGNENHKLITLIQQSDELMLTEEKEAEAWIINQTEVFDHKKAKDANHVFFIMPKNQLNQVKEESNTIYIPGTFSEEQMMKLLTKHLIKESESYKNIITLHGADHKVGTTMLTQSVAQYIAREKKNIRVLLLFLNGNSTTDYIKHQVNSIESLKMRIDNQMLKYQDFLTTCYQRENLWTLGGPTRLIEQRYYYPKFVKSLLKVIQDRFDLILIDAGNHLDDGLCVGALEYSSHLIKVATQNEVTLNRNEKQKDLYKDMNLSFSQYIINRYDELNPHDTKYISKLINVDETSIFPVAYSENEKQAEMDKKALIEYKDDTYTDSIHKLSNKILEFSGLDSISYRKKKSLFSFAR